MYRLLKQISNWLIDIKLKYLSWLFKNPQHYNIGYILSILPRDQVVRKACKSKKRKGKWIIFNGKKVRCYSRKYYFYMRQFYNHKQIKCPICGSKAEYFKMIPSGNLNLFITDYTFNLYGTKDGKQIMFDIDHIKPVSKGGLNKKQNLQILCHDCNNKKADKY